MDNFVNSLEDNNFYKKNYDKYINNCDQINRNIIMIKEWILECAGNTSLYNNLDMKFNDELTIEKKFNGENYDILQTSDYNPNINWYDDNHYSKSLLDLLFNMKDDYSDSKTIYDYEIMISDTHKHDDIYIIPCPVISDFINNAYMLIPTYINLDEVLNSTIELLFSESCIMKGTIRLFVILSKYLTGKTITNYEKNNIVYKKIPLYIFELFGDKRIDKISIAYTSLKFKIYISASLSNCYINYGFGHYDCNIILTPDICNRYVISLIPKYFSFDNTEHICKIPITLSGYSCFVILWYTYDRLNRSLEPYILNAELNFYINGEQHIKNISSADIHTIELENSIGLVIPINKLSFSKFIECIDNIGSNLGNREQFKYFNDIIYYKNIDDASITIDWSNHHENSKFDIELVSFNTIIYMGGMMFGKVEV